MSTTEMRKKVRAFRMRKKNEPVKQPMMRKMK